MQHSVVGWIVNDVSDYAASVFRVEHSGKIYKHFQITVF
jgi:hypothetical protein